jgi:RHS repeat-associated protein
MWGWCVANIFARNARAWLAENTNSLQRIKNYKWRLTRLEYATRLSVWLGFSFALLAAFAPHFAQAAAPVTPSPPAAPSPQTPEMAIPGSGGVSPLGAYTYTIPIQVPPGTKGMAPKLALTYSSSAGDGHLGWGWSLSGLSAITRCPQTFAQDGVHGGVNFDSDGNGGTNDRFCLDGQRLILVSGDYGAPGSTYATESTGFQKIVASGFQGNGPGWFDVWTKDGTHYQYGNGSATCNGSPSSAQVLANQSSFPSPSVRVWAVNAITDTNGNYMCFIYANSGIDYYPTYIFYNLWLGTAPSSVQFNYNSCDEGTRPDVVQTYQAGSLIENATLLCAIQTYNGSNQVLSYNLSYNLANSAGQHDELSSIQLCSSNAGCLPKTTISWQGSRGTLTPNWTSLSSATTYTHQIAIGDFNGDGLIDFINLSDVMQTTSCPSSGSIYYGSNNVTLNGNNDGNFTSADASSIYTYYPSATPTQYSGPACYEAVNLGYPLAAFWFLAAPGDVNGDGITDLEIPIALDEGGVGGEFILSDGQGHLNQCPNCQTPPDSSNAYFWYITESLDGSSFPSDFNGDGLTDLIAQGYVYIGDGQGDFTQQQTAGAEGIFGDFVGNGCTSVLVPAPLQGTTATITAYCEPSATRTSTSSIQISTPFGYNDQLVVGDFNGDGKTDVVDIPPAGSSCADATLYLSTGTGFASGIDIPGSGGSNGWCNQTVVAGDWNGDGKADIAVLVSGGNHQFWLSNGTGLYPGGTPFVETATISNSKTAPFTVFVADWGANGADALLVQAGTQGDVQFIFSYEPEMVSEINNGIGGTVNVAYGRLNYNGGFYTKCPNVNPPGSNPQNYNCGYTYPTQGVDGPLNVVLEIDRSNGDGPCTPVGYLTPASNCLSDTYTYAGLQKDLSGRGILGFTQIFKLNLQTNIVDAMTYNTGFPLTGTVLSEQKSVYGSSNPPVMSVQNTWQSTDLGGAAGSGSAYYAVQLQQSVQSGTDLDGKSPFPTITTKYSYDLYNNISQKAVTRDNGSSSTTTSSSSTTSTWYNYDTANWIVDEPIFSEVDNIVKNGSPFGTSNVTHHYAFCYDDLTGSSINIFQYFGIWPSMETTCQQVGGNTGELTSAWVEPGNTSPGIALTINYGYYDPWGNQNAATYSGSGIASRTDLVFYGANGTFPATTMNGLSETDTWGYDSTTGQLNLHTDADDVTEQWQNNDDFGRPWTHKNPDGTLTEFSYVDCSNATLPSGESCPTNAQYAVITCPEIAYYNGMTCPFHESSDQIAAASVVYYDALNRVIASDTQGLNGCWTRTDTIYGTIGTGAGMFYQTDRPYFLGTNGCAASTQYWTTYAGYDALNRVGATGYYDDDTYVVTNYAYHGLQSSVTNADKETTTTNLNEEGLVASVVDAETQTTSYVYDAFGSLLWAIDPGGNIIANQYDIRQRKTQSSDPDMGTWTYGYDALNELTSQTDNKQQTTSLTYDVLDRLTQRVEPDMTSTWTYGIGGTTSANNQSSFPNSVDRLAQTTCFLGSNWAFGDACLSGFSARSYYYDTFARPIEYAVSFSAPATGNWVSTSTSTSYSSTTGYPTQVTSFSGLTLNRSFNAYGYLTQITDATTGVNYWTANTADPEMQLTQQTAGNGVVTNESYDPATGRIDQITAGTSNSVANLSYEWDLIGNLILRQDTVEELTESFCYDPLNRLTGYVLNPAKGSTCTSPSGQLVKSMGYSPAGNITTKSDVSVANGYAYGTGIQNGAGPHAVTAITPCSGCTVDGSTNPSFSYDANGNMTSGGSRTTSYTSFNMASSIAEGTTSLSVNYDVDHQRIFQQETDGSNTYQTIDLNDPVAGIMAEQFTAPSGTVTWRDYIAAAGNIVAERFLNVGGTNPAVDYFVTDHLGSTSVKTDSTGKVPTGGRLSYDAWGKSRNADGTDDPTCSTIKNPPVATSVTRGFTGQEQIPGPCVVNLNARIYDPQIARLMSADSMVPNPMNGQSFNRYSYVDNGPLSATDTTGHDDGVEGITVTAPYAPFSIDPGLGGGLFGVGIGIGIVPIASPEYRFYLVSNNPGSRGPGLGANVPSCDYECQYIAEWSTTGGFVAAPESGGATNGNSDAPPGTTYSPDCQCLVEAGPDGSPILGPDGQPIEVVTVTGTGGTNGGFAQGVAIFSGASSAGLLAATAGLIACGVAEPCGVAAVAGGAAFAGGLLAGASARVTGLTNQNGLFLTSVTGGLISGTGAGVGGALGFTGTGAVVWGTGVTATGGLVGDLAGQAAYTPLNQLNMNQAFVSGGMSGVGYFAGGSFAVDAAGISPSSAAGLVTSVNGAVISTSGQVIVQH